MTAIAILDDSITDLTVVTKALINYSMRHTKEDFNTLCAHSIDSILSFQADLYILDIDLGKESGFDAACKIHQKYPNGLLIACTSHNELIFESYDYDFFFFVRKQFLESDLERLFQKYNTYKVSAMQSYAVKAKEGIIAVPYMDITYFEVTGNHLYIHTIGETYSERKSMRKLLSELPSGRFVQIDKNFCINLRFIQKISDGNVYLKNRDTKFEIAKVQRNKVRKVFMNYIANQGTPFFQTYDP